MLYFVSLAHALCHLTLERFELVLGLPKVLFRVLDQKREFPSCVLHHAQRLLNLRPISLELFLQLLFRRRARPLQLSVLSRYARFQTVQRGSLCLLPRLQLTARLRHRAV